MRSACRGSRLTMRPGYTQGELGVRGYRKMPAAEVVRSMKK